MNKDTFWSLIQEAKTACGQDMDAMEDYLRSALVAMGPAAAQNFHNILHAYEDLAYRYGLWDAASVIKEYGCSDDGFTDFRAWLIAQGKEVYLSALKDPDTLADVEIYGDCSFECMSYVGDCAYEQLTGRSAYEDMDESEMENLRETLGKEILYKDGIGYIRRPQDLPQFLPRLCSKYGGPARFAVEPSTWNYDLHVVRSMMMDGGRSHDSGLHGKSEKGGGAR